MSPVYLNPQHSSSSIPFLSGDQQHNTLPIYGYLHDHAATTNNSYFSGSGLVNHYTSNEFLAMDYSRLTQDKVVERLGQVLECSSKGGYDGSGCSYVYSFDRETEKTKDNSNNNEDEDEKPKKSKATKLRIMQNGTLNKIIRGEENKNIYGGGKTSNTNESHPSNGYLRMCRDCHTTTTPLWRSGPHGPKSLCNACGIRQRKAKRAALAASTSTLPKDNVSQSSSLSSTTTIIDPSRLDDMIMGGTSKIEQDIDHSHTLPLQKRSKTFVTATATATNNNKNDDNLTASRRTFPRDEEEGAILLMALSCGLACSS